MSAKKAEIRAFVAEHRDELYRHLTEWVAIPSISSESEHADDVRRSAEWLAGALREVGFPTVEQWETPGHPAVFGEWLSEDPAAPTVLVYGHHDVQPVDPLELWSDPPFQPSIRDGEMRGRGVIDDKGQIAFHLLGVRAHLAATGRTTPAVNLKFLIEGEEESGSPHFAQLLRDNHSRLRCDAIVVSDTTMFNEDTPSVCTAMRGMVSCQLDAFGPSMDLHSGVFGGAVPNPIHGLTQFLAGLHGVDGAVTVPGFYDDVIPLTDTERASFAKLPFDEQNWLTHTAHSSAIAGEGGYSTLERIGARPTLEINGIWGGYTGEGDKTVIPAEAHAKVSMRLVAGQDPATIQRLFTDHIRQSTPDGLRFEVMFTGAGVRPCLTPIDHPATQALVRSMRTAFDSEILFTREGGSGPEADLAEILAPAPLVFLGVGLPDDRFHAPNERVRLRFLDKGAEAAAHLWSELAAARLA